MLTPSPNNSLPWSKRQVFRTGFATLWAIFDANDQEVFRIDDITDGGEQTAEFIVIAAKMRTTNRRARVSQAIRYFEVISDKRLGVEHAEKDL